MHLVTRDEHNKIVNPFEMIDRLKKLCNELDCDHMLLYKRVINGGCRIVTSEVIAKTAASMADEDPQFGWLATKIALSNLYKTTKESFSETIKYMYEREKPLVADDVYNIIMEHAEQLDTEIKHERDHDYDYIGINILKRCYLLKIEGKVVERPQHMLMRVAVGIHKNDIVSAINTYQLTSKRFFTHASPTLINAGTPKAQLSSCYVVCMKNSNIDGSFDTLKECAVISKSGGGIGVSIHDIRSTRSNIRGTRSTCSSIIPMLRIFDDGVRYADQEGGRRKGAIAFYFEPWQSGIFEILNMRKNTITVQDRAQDLLYGLWVPDLFMERVKSDGSWSLFCPSEAPRLSDSWGQDFENYYKQYESEGKAKEKVRAVELWSEILKCQIATGTPYMLFKDSCNKKSNQKHIGTIKCSNLCAEIIEYTSPTETAMCNLASIALPLCVQETGVSPESKLVGSIDSAKRHFNFNKLAEITSVVTKNLNKIIDVNDYVVETAKCSNERHRSIGIGVQGLADTFVLLGMAYDSDKARKLNKDIFETIYYHSLKTSCELATKEGPYAAYKGSPVSEGILQPDMWRVETNTTERCNWETLRKEIKEHGVRNSLLMALMPTAVTSQFLGNSECFAPFISNMYYRDVSRASFCVVNKHLVSDLKHMGLWSPALQKQICRFHQGSVQDISVIPEQLKAIYKTVWEIDPAILVDMAADRGCYIDQSQSLDFYINKPDIHKLTALHFQAWSLGLKTGMYRLRSRAAVKANNSSIDASLS